MLYQKLLVGECPYFVRLSQGNSSRGFEEHRHPEIELYYSIKGSRDMLVNKEHFHAREGSLAIISSMTAHELLPTENTEIVSLVMEVGPLLLGRYFEPFAKATFSEPIFLLDKQKHNELILLLDQTARAAENQSNFSELIIKGNLYKICAYILKNFVSENTSAGASRALRTVSNIAKALEHIYANYNQELPVEEVAFLCGYSKTNFCNLFKNVTGTTFHSFLNNHRIKIACELLKETDLCLDDIAIQVGFSDAKMLCRVFKTNMGVTPGEFRKNNLHRV